VCFLLTTTKKENKKSGNFLIGIQIDSTLNNYKLIFFKHLKMNLALLYR